MQPCAMASPAEAATSRAVNAAMSEVFARIAGDPTDASVAVPYCEPITFRPKAELWDTAGAKNRRSHADDRGPFLDGHLEIAAHAHRHLLQHFGRYSGPKPSVAELPKLLEPGAGVLGRVRYRRQRHQSDDPGRL